LSPGGEFFRVRHWEHDVWIYEFTGLIFYEAEKQGWIKICDSFVNKLLNSRLNVHQRNKLIAIGFIHDEENDDYFEPNELDWFDNIPYAKGSKEKRDDDE
jgi:hypothetical protein